MEYFKKVLSVGHILSMDEDRMGRRVWMVKGGCEVYRLDLVDGIKVALVV